MILCLQYFICLNNATLLAMNFIIIAGTEALFADLGHFSTLAVQVIANVFCCSMKRTFSSYFSFLFDSSIFFTPFLFYLFFSFMKNQISSVCRLHSHQLCFLACYCNIWDKLHILYTIKKTSAKPFIGLFQVGFFSAYKLIPFSLENDIN